MRRHLLAPLIAFMMVFSFLAPVTQAAKANAVAYTPVPYEEILPILEKHVKESERVTLDVIGQSSMGHDLYSVVIAESAEDINQSKKLRELMVADPTKAKKFVAENPDVKVPILINGSIHGNEEPGVDAILKLIDRFGYENDEETMSILENNILIFNVVQNPDGRILGTRANGNGFDVNRDFVTLSQPETHATVELMKEWVPMVFLDLHGFVVRTNRTPGLIEPTTSPHNPNTEHDLYLKWALPQAEAMEAELVANKDKFETDLYKNMEGTHIPYRDAEDGWDDYPPIFAPGHGMYHGAYVSTLETPNKTQDGVEWHYQAVMGALKYAVKNKVGMLEDQIEVFRRGVEFDHPDHAPGFFPRAYVLPVDQTDPSATVKTVNHLLKYGVKIHQVEGPALIDGNKYDKGTYIINLNQAKAGLVNTLLWDGEDISDRVGAMYDISAWNLPELWGFEAIPTDSDIDVPMKEVNKAIEEGKLIGAGPYEITNSSVGAIALVNRLIQSNISVLKGENGHFYIEQGSASLSNAVKESGLALMSKPMPAKAKKLERVNVAILNDGGQHGVRTALKQLGFDVTELRDQDIEANGLAEFDVLVANGSGIVKNDAYKETIHEFVSNGGKYIAIGANASKAAVQLELTEATVNSGGTNSNGIVDVLYGDTSITASYKEQDIGFVYNPVWYTSVENDRVAASFGEGKFFKAGFWKNPQPAQGQPVIIKGADPGVTLFGMEVGFRAHPEYLYRLLTNAIYPGEETILTTAAGTKARVERYAKEGAFKNDEDARALTTHLTAVNLYEEKRQADKVVKHMEGFDQLLEHQKNNGLISEKVYHLLKSDTNALIKKWE